jgi:hypothetical protein
MDSIVFKLADIPEWADFFPHLSHISAKIRILFFGAQAVVLSAFLRPTLPKRLLIAIDCT